MRKMMLLFLLIVAAGMFVLPGKSARASEKHVSTDKTGILLVAFGTSDQDARAAIEGIVTAVKAAFPESEVRLSYTSNIIRRKILREEGLAIDTPLMALARMKDDRYSSVTVQSLHILPGEEYHQLVSVVRAFGSIRGKYGFTRLSLGKPLLDSIADYHNTVALLKSKYGSLAGGNGAVVFMGHGTHHGANAAYSKMQLLFDEESLPFIMGVVEGFPEIDSVKRRLKDLNPEKVTLVPFMVVAGDHARNDMADEDDQESWISILKKEGYVVEVLLKGLGDGEGLADLFIDHIREASGGN